MKVVPEQLLLSGVLDVRTRFVRLLTFLDEVLLSASPSERQVIRSVRGEVEKRLKDFVKAVRAEFEGAAVEADGEDDPSKWTDSSWRDLADVANRFFSKYRAAHDDAYPFIQGNYQVPNDLTHFLFRSLDLSLVSSIHRASVAIYTSQFPTWESSAVIADGGSENLPSPGDTALDFVANILVPLAETRSPIRWPLLVHEIGHLLSFGGRRSDQLRAKALSDAGKDPDSAMDDSLSELLADAIAERATGGAFAVAMAREGYLQSFEKHSKAGGPTVKQRLENLKLGKQVAANLPASWKLDGTKLDATAEVEKKISNEDLAAAVEMVAAILDGFPPKSEPADDESETENVKSARALMKLKEPTPAVPYSNLPPQEVFERVGRGRPIHTGPDQQTDIELQADIDWQADMAWVFRSVAETPLTDAEIMEAAWAEDVERPLADLVELIKAAPTPEEYSRLDQEDLRLSRSLQAAAVHQWLVTNDSSIDKHLNVELNNCTAASATRPTPLVESSPLADIQLARRLTLLPEDSQRLVVRPLVDPDQIGGTTIDLRLGTEWETLRTSRFRTLDPGDDEYVVQDLLNESSQEFRLTAGEEHGLVLHPGELLLALTLEYLHLPDDLWGQLEGRSTWARVGLQVHATAGMVDAGFRGYLTLELQNTGRLPIVLYPGLRVGQMAFFPVPNVARPYEQKPNPAYSDQASARTAFTQQHEHRARFKFVHEEKELEDDRVARLKGNA